MILYKILNSDYEPVPKKPCDNIEEAKRYILALLETYNGPFYIQEINIVYTQEK